ncbi:protein of unknown function [Chryseobacterium sp. JV274]|nr:protein of unknown function [Chryseobacterium sp. JV274]
MKFLVGLDFLFFRTHMASQPQMILLEELGLKCQSLKRKFCFNGSK